MTQLLAMLSQAAQTQFTAPPSNNIGMNGVSAAQSCSAAVRMDVSASPVLSSATAPPMPTPTDVLLQAPQSAAFACGAPHVRAAAGPSALLPTAQSHPAAVHMDISSSPVLPSVTAPPLPTPTVVLPQALPTAASAVDSPHVNVADVVARIPQEEQPLTPTSELARSLFRNQQERLLPTLDLFAALATPPGTRPPERELTAKVYVTPIQLDTPDAPDNDFVIPSGASVAVAGASIAKFRGFINQVLIDALSQQLGATNAPAAAAARFRTLFPAGSSAFSPNKDGGRPTGQICVQVALSEADGFCEWLHSHPAGFIAIVASGRKVFSYTHAVVVDKLHNGQLVHQAEVQGALYAQLGVQSAVFYNAREFRDSVIYAFSLAPEAYGRVSVCMGGVASVELLGGEVPIIDYYPTAMRHRLYCAIAGEGPLKQPHVLQFLADSLRTKADRIDISAVKDVALKHANVFCVEFDFSEESYDECLELSTQGFVRIPNPRKPKLTGTKVTIAQQPEDLQLLLGFRILRPIGEAGAEGPSTEIGMAALQVAPTRPRLSAQLVNGGAHVGPAPVASGGSPRPQTPQAVPAEVRLPSTHQPPAILTPDVLRALHALGLSDLVGDRLTRLAGASLPAIDPAPQQRGPALPHRADTTEGDQSLSSRVAAKLLEGYTLLSESCPDTSVPLVQDQQGRILSVGTGKWYQRTGGQLLLVATPTGGVGGEVMATAAPPPLPEPSAPPAAAPQQPPHQPVLPSPPNTENGMGAVSATAMDLSGPQLGSGSIPPGLNIVAHPAASATTADVVSALMANFEPRDWDRALRTLAGAPGTYAESPEAAETGRMRRYIYPCCLPSRSSPPTSSLPSDPTSPPSPPQSSKRTHGTVCGSLLDRAGRDGEGSTHLGARNPPSVGHAINLGTRSEEGREGRGSDSQHAAEESVQTSTLERSEVPCVINGLAGGALSVPGGGEAVIGGSRLGSDRHGAALACDGLPQGGRARQAARGDGPGHVGGSELGSDWRGAAYAYDGRHQGGRARRAVRGDGSGVTTLGLAGHGSIGLDMGLGFVLLGSGGIGGRLSLAGSGGAHADAGGGADGLGDGVCAPTVYVMWWDASEALVWDTSRRMHTYLGVTYASCSSRVRRKRLSRASAGQVDAHGRWERLGRPRDGRADAALARAVAVPTDLAAATLTAAALAHVALAAAALAAAALAPAALSAVASALAALFTSAAAVIPVAAAPLTAAFATTALAAFLASTPEDSTLAYSTLTTTGAAASEPAIVTATS